MCLCVGLMVFLYYASSIAIPVEGENKTLVNLYTFTSCAAGLSIRRILLVLCGMLAPKARGGRRIPTRRLPTRTPSALILRSTRRVKVVATSVVPSAALVLY